MDKRKSRQWPSAYGDGGKKMHLSTSLCRRWYGGVEGYEVVNRARATMGMPSWDQKLLPVQRGGHLQPILMH